MELPPRPRITKENFVTRYALADRDSEFKDFVVDAIQDETREGFTLKFDKGFVTRIEDTDDRPFYRQAAPPLSRDHNAPVRAYPEPGDIIRIFPGTFGSASRGAALVRAGMVAALYFYETAEEIDQRMKEAVTLERGARQKKWDDDKNDVAKRVASLPAEFQKRFEFFMHKPEWGAQFGFYELMTMEQAVILARALSTPLAVEEFAELPFEEQRKRVPQLDEGISGNGLGAALRLAHVFLSRDPAWQVYQVHGAMCPIAGCKEYGCYASTIAPPDEDRTTYAFEERERMLADMAIAVNRFYESARRIGVHQFIEFAGFMNEAINDLARHACRRHRFRHDRDAVQAASDGVHRREVRLHLRRGAAGRHEPSRLVRNARGEGRLEAVTTTEKEKTKRPKKKAHVVWTPPGTFACLHCGATYDLNLPAPISVVVASSRAFKQEHAKCKPRAQGQACTLCFDFGHVADVCEIQYRGDLPALGDRPDTGISSTAIARRLQSKITVVSFTSTGQSAFGNHPADPADFGRCHRLLHAMPGWRARISEMAAQSSVWANLVRHWDELEALYLERVPDGQRAEALCAHEGAGA